MWSRPLDRILESNSGRFPEIRRMCRSPNTGTDPCRPSTNWDNVALTKFIKCLCSRQVDLVLELLRRMSVGSSGAQRPGTHAREKKRETAASSCSKTGWMPVQSGWTSLSEMSCWRTEILTKWPLDFKKSKTIPSESACASRRYVRNQCGRKFCLANPPDS